MSEVLHSFHIHINGEREASTMEQTIHGNTKQKDWSLSSTESRGSDGFISIILGLVFGLIMVRTAKNVTNGTYTDFQTAYFYLLHIIPSAR